MTDLRTDLSAVLDRWHRNSCHPDATTGDLSVGVDAVLAAIRAAGRLAPEVGADVLETAKQAALANHCEQHETTLDTLYSGDILDIRGAINTAAPLIAAAAEAKHRNVLEGILADVEFAIQDHTDGQATLATCRTRLGIIRDHLLAAIRTGATS